jgi:hypothetical protein
LEKYKNRLGTSVFVSLKPNESIIVKVSPNLLKGKEYPFFAPSEKLRNLKTTGKLVL